MKKLVVLAAAVLMLAFTVLPVFASSFTDVNDSDYYAGAAERMAKKGILSGFGDGRYYGDQAVTRAQIAALACKLLGKTAEAEALKGETVFNDVLSTGWYTGYINYAVANGIIVGDGDGKFRPDDYVKYEEVIKVIVCLLDLDGGIKIDPADWSREYLETADKNGLLHNLIGTKGTNMYRSDIAVICDSAYTILESFDVTVETTTETTKKTNNGTGKGNSNSSKPATTTTKPDVTTTELIPYESTGDPVIEEATGDNELPIIWF